GGGPLRQQAARLPAGDAASLAAGSRRGDAAHLHPGRGRLHQRPAPGRARQPHDRERHSVEIPRPDRLSGGSCDVLHPDGRHPGCGFRLRPPGGNRAADGDGGMSSIAVPARSRRNTLATTLGFVRRHLLTAYSILFFAYLLLPIAVVILFSFNHPIGKFNDTWQGFTWDNWRYWDGVPGIRSAIFLSLEIAVVASVIATALGTMIALALVRYGFRGRATTNILIFLPLSTPEIVLGASLLTLFLNLNVVFGFWTILIAHIMFCISFAVVTVKARLVGFDRHLEEAAMDLGANEWTTFRKVTMPLIAPAILASLLLCFAVSIDDFVVTYFNNGPSITFPLFVWGAARTGAPPQVNVFGSAIFTVAVIAMVGNVLVPLLGRASALEFARVGERIVPAVRALPDDVWLREGGMLMVSASSGQDKAIEDAVAAASEVGAAERAVPLDEDAVAARIRSPVFRRGVFFPYGGTVQPARLVQALRRAVREAGVDLYERSPVFRFGDGAVQTTHGEVRA